MSAGEELRLATMRLAKAEVIEHLASALELVTEGLDENATVKQLAQTHRLIDGYVLLAGDAIERFEEAARGA